MTGPAGRGPTVAPFALLDPADRAELPPGLADAYPMTALQQGICWEIARADGPIPYHNCIAMPVDTEVEFTEETTHSAVREVVTAYAALRTSLHPTGFTEPLQLVHRSASPPVAFTDRRHLREPLGAISGQVEAEVRESIDHRRPSQAGFGFHRLSESAGYVALTYSHAILDAPSARRILGDLANALDGKRVHGATDWMPELVARERTAATDPRSVRFWRGQLAGTEGLRLPPRLLPGSGEQHIHHVTLEPALVREVIESAHRLGTSVEAVLLAVHVRVMSMWVREGAIAVGVGRDVRPDGLAPDDAVGLFLNTTPLVVERLPDTWAELIRITHAAHLASEPHRWVPLTVIRDAAPTQLPLDAWFTYRDPDSIDHADHHEAGRTELPLTVTASHSGLTLRADDRYFDSAETAGLGRAYLTTLRAAVSDTSAAPGELSLGHLVAGPDRPEQCRPITELFLRRVAERPHAPAVVDSDRAITTYRELADRSARIAASLQAAGVTRRDVVGLSFARSPELLAALFGVLRRGAAYLPLDPDLPASRLRQMISDADVNLILADPASTIALDGLGITATEPAALPEPALGWTDPVIAADDLAYVLYTSGSTGRPKGVCVSHGGLGNVLTEVATLVGCGHADVVSARTSLSFDISTVELLMPLLTGARVALTPVAARDASVFAQFIAERGVTIAQATPSTWTLLLEQDWRPPAPGIRLLSAGEPLNDRLATYLAGHAPLVNLYGPTEATVYVSASIPRPEEPVTLGRPLANCELAIADRNDAFVPPGVVGELLIGGVGVALRYLNQPELTRERFIDIAVDGRVRRLYRSGDLARELTSGEYEYLGRIDRQIKLRGYRIEPSEVEAVIRAHPDVRSAVVRQWGSQDDPAGRRLVAHLVTTEPELPLDRHELTAWVAEHLPHYMVPADFVAIDAMPVTANGKLDGGRLDEHYRSVASHLTRTPRTAADDPRDDLELLLVSEISTLVDVADLRLEDNFFEIGGNSLSAMRLVARLTAQKVPIELADVFHHPTPARLARAIRGSSTRLSEKAVQL
ncbi:non-ribosomal peptide synthetase [Pseudonocardia spinosispora]|uniref:non-ribosomal peptide synthetase n=1 Tax=Pseudonocardia spinosispora TaxID=103441 RepID=UPI000406B6E1|nr:amino acid adenylation domain-containing protein [Pseudonocardia spinosispora]